MQDVSHHQHKGESAKPSGRGMGLVIVPVFLLLAAWFIWGPVGLDIPEKESMGIDPVSNVR